MSLRMDLSGLHLAAATEHVRAAAPAALRTGMEHIAEVAASRTPIEEGTLVGSQRVHSDGLEAAITYAGPYARYQHERLDLRHEGTGQAKYLESALLEEGDTALGVIAQAIREAL